MKLTLQQIEVLAKLLEENGDLDLTFRMMEGLYSISLQETINRMERGENISVIIGELYPSYLFKELLDFYKQYMTLSQSILAAIEICMQIDQFKKKIINMLIYPMILIASLLCFSIFALIYIKPQFMTFYSSFSIELSLFHQAGINLLFFMPVFLIIMIGIISIITLNCIAILKKGKVSAFQKYTYYFLIGKIMKIYISTKLALYYKEFIKQELSVYEMITFLKEKVEDPIINMIAYEIEEKLIQGIAYHQVINNLPYLDQYLKLTFQLSMSFDKEYYLFDQYYQNTMSKIHHTITIFQRILTPIIYLFVGIYIIGIYCLMVIPMTNMVSQL